MELDVYKRQEFILIDQYILANYLNDHNLNTCNYTKPVFDCSTIALSYQLSKGSYYKKPNYELFLFCRNYSGKPTECEIELITDRNWTISGDKMQFVLDTNKSSCLLYTSISQTPLNLQEWKRG